MVNRFLVSINLKHPNQPNSPKLLFPAAPSLMPRRQRMAEPVLNFSSQRLVQGLGPQQEVRSRRGRQNRSQSIGQLEFLRVPSTSLFSSLSHPSIDSALSPCPHHSSSHAEGIAHFSSMLFHSSHFHSLDASSSLPPEGGSMTRQKQHCGSSSFGYFMLHAPVFLHRGNVK